MWETSKCYLKDTVPNFLVNCLLLSTQFEKGREKLSVLKNSIFLFFFSFYKIIRKSLTSFWTNSCPLFFLRDIFICVCIYGWAFWVCVLMCLCACLQVYMYMRAMCLAATFGNQKKVSDILELALQEVVSLLIWGLGPKFRSSEEAASVLKSWVISLAPSCPLLIGFYPRKH